MFRPLKLKNVLTGVVLGGGENMPPARETVAKFFPDAKIVDDFRVAKGSEIELICSDTSQLWKFLSENTYTDITIDKKGNRYGLTDVKVEWFCGSGDWVITATSWPMEPYYVTNPRSVFMTERVTTGFQQDSTPAGQPPPPGSQTVGDYVLVSKMGEQGGSSTGKHWHLDEFRSTADRGWGKQIPPTGIPGKPTDVVFKVADNKEGKNLYTFGQSPGVVVSSGYGMRTIRGKRKMHRGVDVADPTCVYLYAPAGSYSTQTGLRGYGTYVWCDRFGIGHSDLINPADYVPKIKKLAALSFKSPELGTLAKVSPMDDYSELSDRFYT